MGKINNLQLYPIDQTISLNDFFIGSDADDNLRTVNFSMRDLVQFVGDNFQNVAFIYNVVDNLLPESGEIYLNSGELTFETVTEIRINRRTNAGIDLLNLYQLIRDHNDSIFVRLQTTDPDIAIGYYRVENVVQLDDDFIFTLSTYQSFFRGDYSLEQNMEVVFVHQNQVTFSDILSKPTTIGGYGITDSVRVATLDPSTFILSLSDTDSNVITSVSLAPLNTGGTTIQYNAVTEMIELLDGNGDVISSFPVSALLTNVGSDIAYNATDPSILELRDNANAVLGSVNLTTNNIQDLSTYTGFDSRFYQQNAINDFFSGASPIAGYNKTNWDTAFGWGDHSAEGYLTTIPSNFLVETDTRLDLYQGIFTGDLNNLDSLRGTYRTVGSNTNQPVGQTGFITTEVSGTLGIQKLFTTNGQLYYRGFAGLFTQWRQVATMDDLPTTLPADGGNADTLNNEIPEFYLDHNNLSNIPNFQLEDAKGQPFGFPTLDGNGLIPLSQLPQSALGGLQFQGEWNANTNTPIIPASAEANRGHYYLVNVAGNTDIDGVNVWGIGDIIASNGVAWFKVDNTDSVTSVSGRIGAVVLTSSDVGLGNVNNTSDLAKPISTATQTALNGKLNIGGTAVNSTQLNGQSASFYLNYNNFTNVPLPVDLSTYAQLNTDVTFDKVAFTTDPTQIFIDVPQALFQTGNVQDLRVAHHSGTNEQELRLTDGNTGSLLGMVLRTSTNGGADWENTLRVSQGELTYRGANIIHAGTNVEQIITSRFQVATSLRVEGGVNVQLEFRETNPNGSGVSRRSVLTQINNVMYYLSEGRQVFGGKFANSSGNGLKYIFGGSERDILHTGYSGTYTGRLTFSNGMVIDGETNTPSDSQMLRFRNDRTNQSAFMFMDTSNRLNIWNASNGGRDVTINPTGTGNLRVNGNRVATEGLNNFDTGLRITNGFSGSTGEYPSQLVKVQNSGNDGSTSNYSTMLFHSCERTSPSNGRLRVRMSNRFVGGAGIDIRNIGNNDHELYFLSSNGLSIPTNNTDLDLNQYRIVHEKNLESNLSIPTNDFAVFI